jgi:hypothetical protein
MSVTRGKPWAEITAFELNGELGKYTSWSSSKSLPGMAIAA